MPDTPAQRMRRHRDLMKRAGITLVAHELSSCSEEEIKDVLIKAEISFNDISRMVELLFPEDTNA